MPKVVSNAGPLIALASIGQFALLRSLFGDILIPLTVRAEVLAGGEEQAGVSDLVNADWIMRVTHRPIGAQWADGSGGNGI